MDRRRLLTLAGGAVLATAIGGKGARAIENFVDLPFANGERPLVAYPQKRPLIRLTARPPQLETPFEVFDEGAMTANDAFFVRYHLGAIPLTIDPATYRIEVGGLVERPLSLSLSDLKSGFESQEIVAVNQCSGNSRGFFEPRVGGGQLANGAMGNAKWRGVPLKAILDKAGLKADAKQVTFDGLDRPVIPKIPDFVKALDVDHAIDGEVMVAYGMNNDDLPFLNGFPVRLVVPGYYGTYWVKHLTQITVIGDAFDGFWRKTAYRIPTNACACVEPGTSPGDTLPINKFNVRSFITNLGDGAKVKAGATEIRGIAFDGGYGITDVVLSSDGGQNWIAAKLGEDLGRYSFRSWQGTLQLPPGKHEVMVRATNRIGQSQPLSPLWNPAGYMRNVVERVQIEGV